MNRFRRFRALLQAPRQLLVLFLALTLLPASALVWFGWRLLEQDRILENRGAGDGVMTQIANSHFVFRSVSCTHSRFAS